MAYRAIFVAVLEFPVLIFIYFIFLVQLLTASKAFGQTSFGYTTNRFYIITRLILSRGLSYLYFCIFKFIKNAQINNEV